MEELLAAGIECAGTEGLELFFELGVTFAVALLDLRAEEFVLIDQGAFARGRELFDAGDFGFGGFLESLEVFLQFDEARGLGVYLIAQASEFAFAGGEGFARGGEVALVALKVGAEDVELAGGLAGAPEQPDAAGDGDESNHTEGEFEGRHSGW